MPIRYQPKRLLQPIKIRLKGQTISYKLLTSKKLKSMFRTASISLLSRMNQRSSGTKSEKTVEYRNGSFAKCSPSLTNLLTRSKASKKLLPPRKLTKKGLAWSSMSSSAYLNRKQSNKITFLFSPFEHSISLPTETQQSKDHQSSQHEGPSGQKSSRLAQRTSRLA